MIKESVRKDLPSWWIHVEPKPLNRCMFWLWYFFLSYIYIYIQFLYTNIDFACMFVCLYVITYTVYTCSTISYKSWGAHSCQRSKCSCCEWRSSNYQSSGLWRLDMTAHNSLNCSKRLTFRTILFLEVEAKILLDLSAFRERQTLNVSKFIFPLTVCKSLKVMKLKCIPIFVSVILNKYYSICMC